MPLPPRVLVLHEVLEAIEREIEPYRHSPIETGGVMIGAPIDNRSVLVLGATGPGPRAEHYGTEYALDIGYAQQQLALYHERYPTADYIGEWHRHPDWLEAPSDGDWSSAASILRDPSYKVDSLINPIVVLPSGEFQIRFFYLHRLDLRTREPFQEIPFEAVPRRDPRIADLLGSAVDPASARQPPSDRIDQERREIAERYRVTRAEAVDAGYEMDVVLGSHGSNRVRLICPGSYPYSPPRVELIQNDTRVPYMSRLLSSWSSQRRLLEVVEDARRRTRGGTHALSPPPAALGNWMPGASLAGIVAAVQLPAATAYRIAIVLGIVLLAVVVLVAWRLWSTPETPSQSTVLTSDPRPSPVEVRSSDPAATPSSS